MTSSDLTSLSNPHLRQRNLAASRRSIADGYRIDVNDISYCLTPLFDVHSRPLPGRDLRHGLATRIPARPLGPRETISNPDGGSCGMSDTRR